MKRPGQSSAVESLLQRCDGAAMRSKRRDPASHPQSGRCSSDATEPPCGRWFLDWMLTSRSKVRKLNAIPVVRHKQKTSFQVKACGAENGASSKELPITVKASGA